MKSENEKLRGMLREAYEAGYIDGQNNPNGYSDEADRDECVDGLLSKQAEQQPIQVTAVAVMRDDGDGGLEPDWLLEGGTAELMAGMVLVVAEGDITGDDGHGEVYAAPIAQTAEAEGAERWNSLKLAAEVAEEDGPWEPRLGMTDCETAFAQSASPAKVLELIAALSAVTAEVEALREENQRLKDGALEDLRLRTSALELMNALLAQQPTVHLNAADKLPPVDCPLLIEVMDGYLVLAQRTGIIENKSADMEYRLVTGDTVQGRFRWTYP